jgi:hypothetical protein
MARAAGPGWPRRLLLVLPLVGLAPPAFAAASPACRFRVLREGRPVGTHSVTLAPDGAIQSRLDLEVKLLSFTVFRYLHENAERWQGDRLVGFASRSLRDGRETRVTLQAGPGGLTGQGPDGPLSLPAEAAPLTWWQPDRLQRPLFEVATGLPVRQPPLRGNAGGMTQWKVPDGGPAAVYDGTGRWVGFTMTAEDNSAIRYEPF